MYHEELEAMPRHDQAFIGQRGRGRWRSSGRFNSRGRGFNPAARYNSNSRSHQNLNNHNNDQSITEEPNQVWKNDAKQGKTICQICGKYNHTAL